jgi:2-keto-4-pentenoate hydratase/2-oxohepta-3-ene-1,7-dioic acid hydratase in catechol pathway
MRFVRFQGEIGARYGLVDGDSVRELEGDPFEGFATTDRVLSLGALRLLPPAEPSKVIAVGLNYVEHAQEGKHEPPEEPIIFLKAPSCLIGHGASIVLPRLSSKVAYEAELVAVVKYQARDLEPDEAMDCILGFTCGNDVSAKDLQRKDRQWMRAKSFDTFGPVGPFIETEADPSDLKIELRLNGEVKQSARTSQMIFDVPFLVSFVSRVMTLMPGDLIFTGTPAGVDPILKPGDVLEVEIERVGTLRNPVIGW